MTLPDTNEQPVPSGEVRVEVHNTVATLTLSRPSKRNSMTLSMWHDVTHTVTELGSHPDVRLLVLTGDGDAFSAGADLNEVCAATRDLESARVYCRGVVQALYTLISYPLPTIAAINGVASGGGVELALATDVRVAAPTATLQLPMGRLGVVPDALTLDRLVRTVGPGRAQWMLLTGRAFDADTSLRIGLVDEVAAAGKLDESVERLVADIVRTSSRALRRTKELMDASSALAEDVESAAAAMVDSFLSGEVAAAARSFASRPRGAHSGPRPGSQQPGTLSQSPERHGSCA